MQPETNQYELKRLLEKNGELLKENNELLHKLHRLHLISFWVKILWVAVLVGLPFALYFYILGPYFEALGVSSDTFRIGIGGFSDLREFLELMRGSTEQGAAEG